MASTPNATARLSGEGGGVGAGADLIAVLACSEKGTFDPRLVTRLQAHRDEHGRGEAPPFIGQYIEQTRLPALFIRMATATAGARGNADVSGVTGTSAVTFTGTPFDDEEIVVEVLAGGTIGTAGIQIRVSRDRGRTWSGGVNLGTASTYAIGDSGVTVNFAAGTLVAGDVARQYCSSPRWNAAGLEAALAKLGAYATQPRAVIVLGDVDSADEIQDVIDAIDGYETTFARKGTVFCQLRDQLQPAAMQGAPSDVDFAATGDTITRNTGSFVTDGFAVGMRITIDGTADNDGEHVVTDVTALVLTVASSPGLVDESNVDGADISITGVEPKATWAAAIAALVNGASPAAAKLSHKVFIRGGRARRRCPVYFDRKRRPAMWFEAVRTMQHDLHISSGYVANGPLDGVVITDANGVLEEFDQRVDGGLLESRIGCLMTHDELAGVYVALPLTLDADNGALSRVPSVHVGQLACRVAKAALTQRLGENVSLNADGTLADVSAERIEAYVLGRLEASLLSPGREGPRASGVSFALSRTTDLRTPGTALPYEVVVDGYAYLESFDGTVRFAPGG